MSLGLLEQAHGGGVMYFDEVADMPLGTQSKILRVLVEQQLPAGWRHRTQVRVDHARYFFYQQATCGPRLMQETSGEELYHRLNVVPIRGAQPWKIDARISPGWPEYFIEMLQQARKAWPLREIGRRGDCAAANDDRGRAMCAN